MTLSKNEFKKVQQALSSVYNAAETNPIGDAWEKRVMTRIRGLGPLTSRRGFTDLFERYVWRLVPVAAAAFLILGVVLYQQVDFISECELANVFVQTGVDDSLFQVLGAL